MSGTSNTVSKTPGRRIAAGRLVLRTASLDDMPPLKQMIAVSVRGLQNGEHSQEQIEGALGTIYGTDRTMIAGPAVPAQWLSRSRASYPDTAKRSALRSCTNEKELELLTGYRDDCGDTWHFLLDKPLRIG